MPWQPFVLAALKTAALREAVAKAPEIVNTAANLIGKVRNRKRGGPDRDSTDDTADLQAELISQMAANQEALLRGMQAMASRLVVLSWALAATGALAIAALLLALLR